MSRDIRQFLVSADGKKTLVNTPLDSMETKTLKVITGSQSHILVIDVDDPKSRENDILLSKISPNDLFVVSSQYTLEDVFSGSCRYKVLYNYNSDKELSNPRTKKDENGNTIPQPVEIFYNKSKLASIIGKRDDGYEYVVYGKLNDIHFDLKDVVSYKLNFKLVGKSQGNETIERKDEVEDVLDIPSEAQDVDAVELTRIITRIMGSCPSITKKNNYLLTFPCLFPEMHSKKNNAYAYKVNGHYVCKCQGIVCESEYIELNNAIKQEYQQSVIWDFDGFPIDRNKENNVTCFIAPTGCYDGETEFFNGTGWKKIKDYTDGDLVLQYCLNGSSSLVKPIKFHKYKADTGMYRVKNKHLDMVLSPEHNVYYKNDKGSIVNITMENLVNIHNSNKHGFSGKFMCSWNDKRNGILSYKDRLKIAYSADGTRDNRSKSNRIYFNLKKQRKIDRLLDILQHLNYEYSVKNQSNGFVRFSIMVDEFFEKDISQLLYSLDCPEDIFYEMLEWDGSKKKRRISTDYDYFTTIKNNADAFQFIASSIGYRTSIYEDIREDRRVCYCVNTSTNMKNKQVTMLKSIGRLKIEHDYEEDYKYCFTVPSHMLIMRRNNKIFISGNSGKTEKIAQECLNYVSRNKKLLVVLQSKESINRLKGRINFYSNGALPTLEMSGKLYTWISENNDGKLDESFMKANVIITHHYYLANAGDVLTYYPALEQVLNTMELDIIVDECHTWLELCTQLSIECGGLYQRITANRYQENREKITKEQYEERKDRYEEITACLEPTLTDYGTIELRKQYKVYKSLDYIDLVTEIDKRFSPIVDYKVDNTTEYKLYQNKTPTLMRQNNLEDCNDCLDLILNPSEYILVSRLVGDDTPRRTLGRTIVNIYHYGLLKMIIDKAHSVILTTATMTDYHFNCLDRVCKYDTVVIDQQISKINKVVLLHKTKDTRRNIRKQILDNMNDTNARALMFMPTIDNAKDVVAKYDNMICCDNGWYTISKRVSQNDYIDNFKRNVIVCGLESSVSKGYNFMEEVGDNAEGFDIVYFDSEPVSPDVLKKYVSVDGKIVDYYDTYAMTTFTQAIGRALRKEKEQLTICLNNISPVLINAIKTYLEQTLNCEIVVDELNLTNLKISTIKDIMDSNNDLSENLLYQELYGKRDNNVKEE